MPTTWRPALCPLFQDVSAALGTTGEPAAGTSRQLHTTERGTARAVVVAGSANPEQPSGLPEPIANVSDISEPAASSEANNRRMSPKDMSEPSDGMPAGTTSTVQGVNKGSFPQANDLIKHPLLLQGSLTSVTF